MSRYESTPPLRHIQVRVLGGGQEGWGHQPFGDNNNQLDPRT
jgi:hypothetical protein